MNTLFLRTMRGENVSQRPVWLMRQAGRYLPEYLEFRQRHSLLSCFKSPDLASEITWMPLRRFELDAAILFSDLLVLGEVWGKSLSYPESGGALLSPPLQSLDELHVPSPSEIKQKLSYVFQTIDLLKPKLLVPLLGFCGAPFTMLCYLLQGKAGGFSEARTWINQRREEFIEALDLVCETCTQFALLQIERGVDAFQVFDSWANLLSEEEFLVFALPYWKKMKEALSDKAPIIFFGRNNSQYPELISSFSPDCISFDENKPLIELRRKVPSHVIIQGNFSPELLLRGSREEVREKTREMVESVSAEKGIIWNLGHGVLPKTPIENVETFLNTLRSPTS